MASKSSLDRLFMDISERVSEMSHSRRTKVGASLVKNGNIISMGWNGTPPGFDNNCEVQDAQGVLTTKACVIHAEANAILKLAAVGGGAEGADLFCVYSPCQECAKLIVGARIARVVYKHQYRLFEGLEILREANIIVERLNEEATV